MSLSGHPPVPPRAPRATAVLWLIPAIYFTFVGSEFAAITHLALQATAAGRSALAVGLLAAALWAGILMASTQAHRAVQRFGHGRVFVAAVALSLGAMLTLPWHSQHALWCAALAVLGLGGGLVWVAGEAWLAEEAPPERRGVFVGLFEFAVGLGLMAGPALVALTHRLQGPTLWVSAALMALTLALSLLLLRAPPPGQREDDLQPLPTPASPGPAPIDWLKVAGPMLAVASVSGLMESGVSALLPSVAMRLGFDLPAAALLGTVIGAGSALLQPPMGHLADRYGVRRITLAAWLGVLLANATLLAMATQPATVAWVLWGVGFTLGGLGGAVYTLMIVELGHQLRGPALVKAISALVVAYALGTVSGPVLGGAVFDAGGLQALSGLLLAVGLLGLSITAAALRSASPGPSGPRV